jgi:hypothetical protein
LVFAVSGFLNSFFQLPFISADGLLSLHLEQAPHCRDRRSTENAGSHNRNMNFGSGFKFYRYKFQSVFTEFLLLAAFKLHLWHTKPVGHKVISSKYTFFVVSHVISKKIQQSCKS